MLEEGFSTERLSVRDWSPDLLDPQARNRLETTLADVLSARVLKHLPDPIQLAVSDNCVSAWITARAGEAHVYLVSETATAGLVGLLFLAQGDDHANRKTCHIGYLLSEEAWGKGFATELVKGLIGFLGHQGKFMLVGGVGIENKGSARVLEKAGFNKSGELSDGETDMFVLALG